MANGRINIKKAHIKNIDMCAESKIRQLFTVAAIQNVDNNLFLTSSGFNRGVVTQEDSRENFFRQRWLFAPVRGRTSLSSFYLFDTSTNLVMAPLTISIEENVPLIVTNNNNNIDKRWNFNLYTNSSSEYFILNEFSLQAITNLNNSSQEGNEQVQASLNVNFSQRFRVNSLVATREEINFMRRYL